MQDIADPWSRLPGSLAQHEIDSQHPGTTPSSERPPSLTSSLTGNAFGAKPSPFGGFGGNTATTSAGNSLFGSTTPAPSFGGFGSTNTQTSGFGSNTQSAGPFWTKDEHRLWYDREQQQQPVRRNQLWIRTECKRNRIRRTSFHSPRPESRYLPGHRWRPVFSHDREGAQFHQQPTERLPEYYLPATLSEMVTGGAQTCRLRPGS